MEKPRIEDYALSAEDKERLENQKKEYAAVCRRLRDEHEAAKAAREKRFRPYVVMLFVLGAAAFLAAVIYTSAAGTSGAYSAAAGAPLWTSAAVLLAAAAIVHGISRRFPDLSLPDRYSYVDRRLELPYDYDAYERDMRGYEAWLRRINGELWSGFDLPGLREGIYRLFARDGFGCEPPPPEGISGDHMDLRRGDEKIYVRCFGKRCPVGRVRDIVYGLSPRSLYSCAVFVSLEGFDGAYPGLRPSSDADRTRTELWDAEDVLDYAERLGMTVRGESERLPDPGPIGTPVRERDDAAVARAWNLAYEYEKRLGDEDGASFDYYARRHRLPDALKDILIRLVIGMPVRHRQLGRGVIAHINWYSGVIHVRFDNGDEPLTLKMDAADAFGNGTLSVVG